MAKKAKTVFVCQDCGSESPKWQGQCSACGSWNTLLEQKIITAAEDDKRRRTGTLSPYGAANQAGKLSDVRVSASDRIDTGIRELNRVLGGGIVPGSLVLVSGEPGIGKSTIIIQAAANIAEKTGRVLYVSGEESEEQIKLRADRVCGTLSGDLLSLSETNIESVSMAVEETDAKFLIIDSIQTMYSGELDSAPGSISQVRVCGSELMRIGKVRNVPVFIVAHVTKSGDLAGPKTIEHMVDCVLNFSGERNHELRILRANKNRFGATSEIGAFEMTQRGLIQIENLSGIFLEGMECGKEGSIATAVYEGTRPLLLEIQALTVLSNAGFARRTALGVERNRLNMLLAVLERRAGISLNNQDVYVNIVGGLRPEGTFIDLAAALAIYSAYKGKAAAPGTLAIGEIGLTGELRCVQNVGKIVKEAERMGFRRIIMPKGNADRLFDNFSEKSKKMEIVGVKHICEAIETY